MTKFDDELSHGRFILSFCSDCQKFVWPPASYCNICHNATLWKNTSKHGKILEFSKKEHDYFCLIETDDDIRVLGCVKSLNEPKLGQSVELEECSFDKKPKFLFKLV